MFHLPQVRFNAIWTKGLYYYDVEKPYPSHINFLIFIILVTTTSVSSLKDGFLAGNHEENDKHDRAPSWKVRLAENTKNKV